MEHHEISKLLDNLTTLNFVARKSMKVNNISNRKYSVNNNIRFKTHMLKSNLH